MSARPDNRSFAGTSSLAARGHDNAICITVGSGIGSGLLIGGRIHEGSHNLSRELGLARIPDPGAACLVLDAPGGAGDQR